MPRAQKRWATMLLLISGCALVPGSDELFDPDGDDYAWGEDCGNAEAAINPSATDIVGDGIDQNCDGLDGTDTDRDGQPSSASGGEDCNDTDPTVFAGAPEDCSDGQVNDCLVSEAVTRSHCGLPATLDLAEADAFFSGESEDSYAGRHVTSSGDVNGDGRADLLIGSVEAANVVLGPAATSRSLSEADAQYQGDPESTDYGYVVSSAGDLNADGFDDVLVGAQFAGSDNAGAAYVLFSPVIGTADLDDADLHIFGERSGSLAGDALSSAGDFDGDGLTDIVVGAPGNGGEEDMGGDAYILLSPMSSSVTLGEVETLVQGESASDSVGAGVSAAGDTDGDGLDDVLISAPHANLAGTDGGAACIVSGGTRGSLLLSDLDLCLLGEASGDQLGYSVSGWGDTNGDGLADIVAGAYEESSIANENGAAYLLEAPASGMLSAESATAKIAGATDADRVGISVCMEGDLDGDGHSDLLVGAHTYSEEQYFGGAAFLALTPLSGHISITDVDSALLGSDSNDYAGRSVSTGGDVNRDGYDDMVIGRGGDSGGTYLVLGSGF